MAERLNAQMVLYGNIYTDQRPARLVIEAWFTPQPYYDFEDIQGSHQTGGPILLADPAKPGLEAQPEVRNQASAFAWLAIGLTRMRLGQSDALSDFKNAIKYAPQSAEVQYFYGEESLFLSDSDLAHQHILTQAAEDAFQNTLTLDPQYVRANIGLGSVYSARAKRLVDGVQDEKDQSKVISAMQDADKQVDLAMAAYNRVLQAPASERPAGVPVDLAARLGIGTSLKLRGQIRQYTGQNDEAMQAFQQAVQELEAIIQPLQEAKQERYLAQTYQILGASYQLMGYITGALKKDLVQSKTEYTGAAKYYDLCTSLGDQSLDLIVKNDIGQKLCAPARKDVQGKLNDLSGGS
jgi:tetratricopeptide (TPR) repeat protein